MMVKNNKKSGTRKMITPTGKGKQETPEKLTIRKHRLRRYDASSLLDPTPLRNQE